MLQYTHGVNKRIVRAAVIAAVAIGIVVGTLGTTGVQSAWSQNSSANTSTQTTATQQEAGPTLSGTVAIDGSSTVYPITEVIAENFSNTYPNVQTTVGISGTGGGFERFSVGETDINDSSRPIDDEEKNASATNNVRWIEIPIGLEGLTIVVHPDNNMVPNDCISLEELREMWLPNRTMISWSDLNQTNPNQEIRLYGAGPDSGTFDYFTERVNGESGLSTTEYIPSEDDNVLVQGVANDMLALGYIPLAYSDAAGDRLKILNVSETRGGECVYPDANTVTSEEYPLSRPLFLHVNYDKYQSRPELQTFVEFYLSHAMDAIQQVRYVTLPEQYYTDAVATLRAGNFTQNDQTTFNNLY
jgi:phosphate transport system substrate-binding protein